MKANLIDPALGRKLGRKSPVHPDLAQDGTAVGPGLKTHPEFAEPLWRQGRGACWSALHLG
jgi:fumarate hydratase class II